MNKSPADNEPEQQTIGNDHVVRFQKAGWFTFAYCKCSWIDCDADVGMLTIKAAVHGIIPGRPV